MSELEARILADLNPPQREAVETLQGPLLILAGAGSGKTRVVTRRIANLIAHGVRPWQILAITFTNKAAAEMRERVERLAGTSSGVWLSTFHSFCARMLRRDGPALGFSQDFTIYDEDDALGVLKDIVKGLGLSEDKRYSARNVRQVISKLKSKATTAAEVRESEFGERVVAQIYKAYQEQLLKNQALDFDDLLLCAVRLFREHKDILERYQDRFQHLLVDEYQDTNGCQYLLVKLLGQKHRNVCATGDPDQSIYAWRGADVKNILSFEHDFPEAKVVKLEQNYRSTQRILAAASAVIENNTKRKKKKLWTENDVGEHIALISTGDEQLEAYEAVKAIETHVSAGKRYNEMAIFYRTNAQSRPLETALIQASIPYQLVGGTAFYERREVKDALAYLRLLVNPQDDVSFRRILNVPRRGLGPAVLDQIAAHGARTGKSLLQTISDAESDEFLNTFKPKPKQALINFVQLFDKLRALPAYPVATVLRAAVEDSGLVAALQADKETERIENLGQLLNAAEEFDKDNNPEVLQALAVAGPPPEPGAYDDLEELTQRQASVAGFLENSALLAPTDKFDPAQERVTLMTLHMAKGLEFPVVFLTGVEEGLCPLVRTGGNIDEPEDGDSIEEERRLVYVGITRAKEKLYLSRAMYRRRFGKTELTVPSRFLSEIPDKLLEVQNRAQPLWAAPFGTPSQPVLKEPGAKLPGDEAFAAFERELDSVFSDEQARPPRRPSSRRHDAALQTVVDRLLDVGDSQETPAQFEVGDKVSHDMFGEGIIENISGINDSIKVKVHFRKHGPKLLLLSMARLKKIER